MFSVDLLKEFLKLKWTTRNPRTFNEKIRYKSAHDRRPILTVFADKIKVRDYVANVIGSEYLPKIYSINYDLDSIDWNKIPEEFVFKVNHGSNGIVVVTKDADRKTELPKNLEIEGWTIYKIHPDSLIKDDLVRLGKRWLTLDYTWFEGCGRMPEWAYKNIRRGALFEELLVDKNGGTPPDYKFSMLNGKCGYIVLIHRDFAENPGEERKTTYTMLNSNWEKLDLTSDGLKPLETTPKRPIDFGTMLKIAEQLSDGIDFVRVDLYNVEGRILFGELTNYPLAGLIQFEPKSFDLELGEKLVLDNYMANNSLFKLLRRPVKFPARKT